MTSCRERPRTSLAKRTGLSSRSRVVRAGALFVAALSFLLVSIATPVAAAPVHHSRDAKPGEQHAHKGHVEKKIAEIARTVTKLRERHDAPGLTKQRGKSEWALALSNGKSAKKGPHASVKDTIFARLRALEGHGRRISFILRQRWADNLDLATTIRGAGTAVPEPGTIGLGLLGLAGFGCWAAGRRRERKKKKQD